MPVPSVFRRTLAVGVTLSVLAGSAALAAEPGDTSGAAAIPTPTAVEPSDRFSLQRLVTGGARTHDYTDVQVSDDGSAVVFEVRTPPSDGTSTTGPEPDALDAGVWRYLPATTDLDLVSVLLDGQLFSAGSPAVSADGSKVAFTAWGYVQEQSTIAVSSAEGGGSSGTWGHAVFVRDLTAGTTRRVSPVGQELHAVDQVGRPSLSDDGAVVAYAGAQRNDQGDITGWAPYVADAAGVRAAGPGGQGRTQLDEPLPAHPVVSGDGTRLAYAAYTNEVGWQLFADDLEVTGDAVAVGTVVPASGAYSGRPYDAISPPSLSADGDVVAYPVNVDADNYVGMRNLRAAPGAEYRAKTFDDGSSTYPYVSNSYPGVATYGYVSDVDLSGDARWLTFSSMHFEPDGAGGGSSTDQVWRVDLTNGASALVSHTPEGIHAAGQSTGAVSRTGAVAFSSTAADLVANDTNGRSDVFLVGAAAAGHPAWEGDATLTAGDPTDTQVYLSWTPATASDVTGYRLYRDGRTVATPNVPNAPATGLTPATPYVFTVRGTRDDGSVSSDALRVEVQTDPPTDPGTGGGEPPAGGGDPADTTAPTWPSGAAATVSGVAPRNAMLSWPAATDDTAVAGYRVTVNGDGGYVGQTTSHVLNGLLPETTYAVSVAAVDGSGNYGPALAAASFRTPFDPASLITLSGHLSGGGAVTLNWRSGTGVDDHVVLRSEGDGELVEVGRVAASATTFRDTGLKPGTAYRYRVDRADGTELRRFTTPFTVTTLPLSISSFEFETPVNYAPSMGDALTFTVEADAGATSWVDATVLDWFDGKTARPAPAEEARRVDLTETSPGSYTGELVLEEGIAEVTAMTARATHSGSTAERPARYLPGTVSGAIAATVNGSWPELKTAVLTARSDKRWIDAREVVGDRATVVLPALRPTDDYRVRLFAPTTWGEGERYAELDEVTVLPGRTTAVDLTPRVPAELAVVPTVNGEFAFPRSVVVTDPATGSVLASWSRGWWSDASSLPIAGLAAGQEVAITTTFPTHLPVKPSRTQTLTLVSGTNRVEVPADALPRSPLTVEVLLPDPDPADGATVPAVEADVTVTQTVDGRPWTYRGTTGEDGRVQLDVLAGDATVRANKCCHNEQSAPVTVGAGTDPVVIQLYDSRPYTLDVSLTTKLAGRDPVVQRMDGRGWTVPVSLTLRNGYRSQSEVRTSPVTVVAEPGDELELCARTTGNLFPPECRPLTAPKTGSTITAEHFELTQFGALSTRLVDAEGDAWQGRWEASLQPLDPAAGSGAWTSGSGSQLNMTTTWDGPFRLVVRSGRQESAPVSVTVPQDAVATLPDVVLGSSDGYYLDRSDVTAPTEEVVAGSTVEVRNTWQTVSYLWGGAQNARLEIPVPAGTSLVPDSPMLDDQQVPVTPTANGFTVALPDGVDRGTFRYRLLVEALEPGVRTPLSAALLFIDDGAERRAVLGVAEIRAPGVTLVVPGRTALGSVPASGLAPAHATVVVRSAGRVLDEVVASKYGHWRTKLELPYMGPQHNHILEAVVLPATEDGQELRSPEQVVTFDLTAAELTKVVVRQEGRSAKEFDPREGLAQFQFVFVPHLPLKVELEFTSPELVKDLSVTIGAEDPVEAVYDDVRRLWVVETKTKGQGQISADWGIVVPTFFPGQPVPSPDDVRAGLPPEVASIPVITTVSETQPTITADMGAAGQLTVEVLGSQVVPGAPLGGAEVEDVTLEHTSEQATVTADITVTHTWEELESGGSIGEAVAASLAKSDDPALRAFSVSAGAKDFWKDNFERVLPTREQWADMANRPDAKVTTSLKVIEKWGSAAFGIWSFYNGVTEHRDKVDELERMAVWCTKGKDQANHELIRGLRLAALAADTGGAVLGLATGEFTGIKKGPRGSMTKTRSAEVFDMMPGVDTKLAAAGWGIDQLMGAQFNGAYDAVKNLIKYDPDCDDPNKPGWPDKDPEPDKDDPDKPGKPRNPPGGGGGPLAKPWWLHDPSGNVFSGVQSHPVQGVTATVFYAPTAKGPWEVWNAEDFGQENPQSTDAAGYYGWDVLEGFWQVVYEKDGYETQRSEVLEVLPPHFDVHVGMLDTSPPVVDKVSVAPDGSVDIVFDRHMLADSVVGRVAVTSAGTPVPGAVSLLDQETAPDDRSLHGQPYTGRTLTKGFRFTPSTAPAVGTALKVTVDDAVVSYADRTMGGDHVVDVTVPAVPRGDDGGTPPPSAPPVAWAPGSWTAKAGDTVPPGVHLATTERPVLVTVTAPVAGEVSIAEVEGDVPHGWRVLGQQLQIEAPDAQSPDAPLVLRFRVDRSALPDGEEGLDVLRDGQPVSEQCTGAGARPDPCLTTSWDGDDLVVEVRSTHASRWAIVLPADAPVDPPVDVAPVCPEDAPMPFRDVADDSVHRPGIACLAALDITRGVADRNYRPAQQVTRAQMASFLARMLDHSGVDLPAGDGRFEDTGGSVHATAIGQLAALGIVEGVSRRSFEPDKVVTREQMASFLVRSYEVATGEQRPAPTDRFSDDDASVHEAAIDAAAALGVTTGVTADSYAPAKPVQRDQMASFLARLLAAVHAEG